MATRWTFRRAHFRRLKWGRLTRIPATLVFCETAGDVKAGCYPHQCQKCGAEIISVRMPNKGWGHFEAARGLTRVKHPCMHMGEGLSRARDDMTPDLFATILGDDEGAEVRAAANAAALGPA
jgi:hypothetical protein